MFIGFINKLTFSMIAVVCFSFALFLVSFDLRNTAYAANSYVKTFTVSAYYSPLPNQDRYSMGSYDADIRMNGRGTHGADGTPVYVGMIAAPKSYAFGTVMDIPGIGTVSVHDRGGAIVEHDGENGVHDRLDIWMGHGDEGLTRALNWGKRNVDVTVYADKPADYVQPVSAVRPDVNVVTPIKKQPIIQMPVKLVEVTPAEKYGVSKAIIESVDLDEDYLISLTRGATGAEVSDVQRELAAMNFYKGPINGLYDDLTIHAVYKFQQSQGIVANSDDLGAGVFGPKTRARINEIVGLRNEKKVRVAVAMSNYTGNDEPVMIASVDVDNNDVQKNEKTKNTDGNLLIASELNFGMTGETVRTLQGFLASNGYIDASRATAYYGDETRAAVLKFQLDNGIVTSEADTGAGRVGPATKRLINVLG